MCPRPLLPLVALLLLPASPGQAASWSGNGFIERVIVRDDLGVLRVEFTASHNPAGCLLDDLVDFRLDAPDRTPVQERQLIDAINLAFVTERPVRFLILDDMDSDPCSTEGTSSSIRVGAGITVLN